MRWRENSIVSYELDPIAFFAPPTRKYLYSALFSKSPPTYDHLRSNTLAPDT
ncbi:hypothetical protein ACVIJ6_003162 [Bradyrhizobium sp. USDA 4369]